MTSLVLVDLCTRFEDAAKRAKALAASFSTPVAVERAGDKFAVKAPHRVSAALAAEDRGYSGYENYDEDSERDLIADERMSDQEDWGRSNRDGWFYSDD